MREQKAAWLDSAGPTIYCHSTQIPQQSARFRSYSFSVNGSGSPSVDQRPTRDRWNCLMLNWQLKLTGVP